MRLPAIARRAGLVLLGLLGAFGLCEAGFRIVERVRLSRAGELWATYDEALGWRNNPRFPGHDEQGLRGPGVAQKLDRYRVLMLGDSVIYYGDGDGDTLPGRLASEISRFRAPGSFDVLNAGVRGYTNRQELDWLAARGVALEPDLVGVAFVLNDCTARLHRFRVEDGRIVGQDYELSEEAVGDQPGGYHLLRRSRFLVWLRHRLASVEPEGAGFSFDARPDFRNAWRDEPWRDVESQLVAMIRLGREHGFRLFLVVFPFGDQYREDYLARDRERVLKPQRELARICAELAIPFLDLHPLLDRARDLEADGIHLTAQGRRRAAAAIAASLVNRRLLERE